MKATLALSTVGFLLAVPASAATLGQNAFAYALGNEGRSVVTIATPDDAAPSAVDLDFGGADVTLDTITYRPATRQFYGYDNASGTIYTINPRTGSTMAVISQAGLTTTDDLGIDFNNALDAARIVTAANENRVFFPNNTPPNYALVTELAYGAGDVNESADPNIVANAYTNAVPSTDTTLQYALDSDLDVLTTLANNAGTLTTIGGLFLNGLPFDMTSTAGFDILSFSEGDNTAYALLTDALTLGQGLFQVSLFADSLGRVNMTQVAAYDDSFGTLTGLAVAPVPVPAALPLALGGLALLGFVARRRG